MHQAEKGTIMKTQGKQWGKSTYIFLFISLLTAKTYPEKDLQCKNEITMACVSYEVVFFSDMEFICELD